MTPSPELLAVAEACDIAAGDSESLATQYQLAGEDEDADDHTRRAKLLREHAKAIRAGRILHIQPRDPDDEGGLR